MSTNERRTEERTDLESRDERALTECMSVLGGEGSIYTVVGENGGTYTVDAREERCTCPDHTHRNARCKHVRRVAYATGETTVPAGFSGVDPQLGTNVSGGGPIIAASDGGEVLDEDCDCDDLPEELPCWSCYRDGDDDGRDEPRRSEPADFGHGESTGVQDL